MKAVLVLVVVVGGCVCVVAAQPTTITTPQQETRGNDAKHVATNENEVKVQSDVMTQEADAQDDKGTDDGKSEGVKTRRHFRRRSKADDRLLDILKGTEAKILQMNKRHPNRGKLKTLPGLARLKEEEMSRVNATPARHVRECVFACPDAASLAPCTCDPCTHDINCSLVTSFEQLYNIFHATNFPESSFNQFLMRGPLKTRARDAASTRSDTFLAQTFGNVSFTSVWVEEVTQLRVVESGAFDGSEGTLTKITFTWNYALTSFPFSDMAKLSVLDQLEVRGSKLNTVPALPYAPQLTILLLSDNFISTIPPKAFAQLPSLLILDLGYNYFQIIPEEGLYFLADTVHIYLDHNAIDTIHERAFSGLQPANLDVSSNNLAELDQRVFQPILDHIIAEQFDSYVDASYNPLQCGALEWLTLNSDYLMFVYLSDPPCM